MPAVHIMPTEDLVEHECEEDCVCVPECVPVVLEDGSMGWLYVHHALDGRD